MSVGAGQIPNFVEIQSDDDDEMQDLPASSPAARSRCSSAHSAATAREEDEGWKAPIVLEMYLCFGQVAHSAGQHAEWAGEIAMNECDQVQDDEDLLHLPYQLPLLNKVYHA